MRKCRAFPSGYAKIMPNDIAFEPQNILLARFLYELKEYLIIRVPAHNHPL
ncbi:Uncharacterized protein dnm_082550 [Desulfonema magnum]|uniref:Uncharacterized protein n=1 Tax=Desulfonema magnum TaxID=45655 RepID=A0A975BUW0_9BACT|nr:Uncharacterized protein dnm_082550 [Desulfonema magnum]